VKLDAGNDFIRNTKSTGQHDNDKNEALVSDEHIKSEISKANSRLKTHNTKCEFGYHEGTNRVTIKVLDKDTSEVLREIPPEKTLEMIQKMWELAGILIDERR
jgi:flagellar protein FlaG